MKMKRSRKWKQATIINCVSLALVFGVVSVVGMAADSYATGETSASTSAAVTINTTCQMSSVEDIPHTATLAGGVYRSEIGKTTITALCNDANGFAIYAVGFTNNELGRNEMLGSNTGWTIATGTATTGNTSNWAMKLTAVDGTYKPTILSDTAGSFASYHAIPASYTKVADYSGNTDDVTGSKMETTYAAYATSTQNPDTYNGKVKFTLMHPSTTPDAPCTGEYLIAYNANGGSGSMESQTACVDRQVALLPNGFTAPAPTLENRFVFWNTKADGSGYSYSPGQSVTNLAAVGESVTLYAIWGPKYIQELTAATCNILTSTPINPTYTVYDRRDGSDYTVRYIEGACWMTQNLRITGAINRDYSNFDSVMSFDVSQYDLKADGAKDDVCYRNNGYNNVCSHIPEASEIPTGYTSEDIGAWYNYAAATAGQITGSSNTTEATQDICPAGWNMPSYNTAGGAGTINSILGSEAVFTPVVGGRYDVQIGNTNLGFLWSTTPSIASDRQMLIFNGSNLSTNHSMDSYRRYHGYFIRCVRTL